MQETGTPIKPNHYKIVIKGTEYQVRDVIEAVIKDMPGIRAGYVFNVLKFRLVTEVHHQFKIIKKEVK